MDAFSPVTLHLCRMASSYALLTAFLSAGFLDCTSLALSSSESTPRGSSLSLTSHCQVRLASKNRMR